MDWILNNLPTILAVLGFCVAAWKAWKNGTLVDFLVKRVEPLADKSDKDAIKAAAESVGLQGLLQKAVERNKLSTGPKPTPPTGQ